MNHTDNQGRGDREQLPSGAGIVVGLMIGLSAWAVVSICWIGITTIWP
jgi:hypothetical protein